MGKKKSKSNQKNKQPNKSTKQSNNGQVELKREYKFEGGFIGFVERIVGGFTMANLLEWVKSAAVAVAIALVIRQFLIEPFKIPSGSMEDTLKIGDKILVNKFVYGPRIPFTGIRLWRGKEPQRGHVVVFKTVDPATPKTLGIFKKNLVKRVIGRPGERVKIDGGKILINGEPVTDPPEIANQYYYNDARRFGDFATAKEITVPDDHYFVLGDNSAQSRDGRKWGYVPFKNIKGRAFAKWWPPGRIGRLR